MNDEELLTALRGALTIMDDVSEFAHLTMRSIDSFDLSPEAIAMARAANRRALDKIEAVKATIAAIEARA
jgi:hypothetical protein